ncbi:MAG TPA: hypothetical protein VF625_07775 [Longimicrobium sp.]
MKKLKLELGDLEVTSFAAQDQEERGGTVNAMQSYYATECLCTNAEGCYPSLYCSQGGVGPGEPYGTCYPGCMTNERGEC